MPVVKPRITIQEVDGSPTGKPGTLKFPNGTITDNGDGTFTYTPASAGGQTLVTFIVAASGGDYTTLGAAIAAASNGDTIWVREGSYTETTITSSLTGITIIGEGRKGTILNFGTTTTTFSGIDVTLSNLRIIASTGKMVMSGANSLLDRIDIVTSGNSQILSVTGANSKIRGLYYSDGSSSYTTLSKINFASIRGIISDSYFLGALQTGVNKGTLSLNADGISVSACTFNFTGTNTTNSSHLVLESAAIHCSVNSCTFLNDPSIFDFGILTNGSYNTITGCTFKDAFNSISIASSGVTDHVITGNIIRMSQAGNGIDLNGPRITISGNIISNSAGSGDGVDFTASAADDCVVTNNIITGFANGVNYTSTTALNSIVTGNNLEGNTVAIDSTRAELAIIFNNTGASAVQTSTMLFMKNTSGATINAGNVVTHKSVAAGDEITTTTTASDNKVFGVALASISNNAYGYIMTYGKTTQLTVNGTTDIAIGDFLTTFTSAGIAKKASVAALGVTLGDLAFAIALEAYTTDDSSGVIDALIINPRRL